MFEETLYSTSTPSMIPDVAARPASLTSIIGRIEEAVDLETAGLKAGGAFDLKASNARKSRCLYELSRAMKGAPSADLLAEHRHGLQRLRDKLARNESALRAHISAVTEVAALMQDAIRRSETDGTYSSIGYGEGF